MNALNLTITMFFILFYTNSFSSDRVIVQLFEWKWRDIAIECEKHLGPAGYTAVQVSPVNEHIHWALQKENFPWWERYQPVSYKIISRSGNEDEFRNMVKRCSKAGVDIYVDVVINHMTGLLDDYEERDKTGIGKTKYGHYDYGNIYGYDDFHHLGIHIPLNFETEITDPYILQFGELYSLADLKTESTAVRKKIISFLNHLIDIGVKGFRIDAAKHIPAKDLGVIYSHLKGSPYIYQEYFSLENYTSYDTAYMKLGDLTFPKYSGMLKYFFKNNLIHGIFNELSRLEMETYSSKLVIDLENHDSQRSNMSIGAIDFKEFDLANVFMLGFPYGTPRIMSSYIFDDRDAPPPVDTSGITFDIHSENFDRCGDRWVCEHRKSILKKMIYFRKKCSRKKLIVTGTQTNNTLSFIRKNCGFVAINNNQRTLKKWFNTMLKPGRYCNYLDDSEENCIDVNNNGWTHFDIRPKSAFVILAI